MLNRIARSLSERRWIGPLIALALAVICVPAALAAPTALGVGRLAEREDAALTIVATAAPGTQAKVADVAFTVIRSQLESDPELTVSRKVKIENGVREATFTLRFDGDSSPGPRRDALAEIPATIDPGPLTIRASGSEASLQGERERIGSELWRWELIGLPAILLLASWSLGFSVALWSALAALLGSAVAVASLRLLSGDEASAIGLAVAVPVAVAAAIQGCAALARRHGELPQGAPAADRVESMLLAGGIDCAAFVAGGWLAALFLGTLDFAQAGSLALAAMAGALGGTLAALVLASAAGARRVRPEVVDGSAKRLLNALGRLPLPAPNTSRRRRALGALLRAAAIVAVLAGPPALVLAFSSELGELFDRGASVPGIGGASVYAAVAVGLSLALGRAALGARYLREEWGLGGKPESIMQRVSTMSFAGNVAASLTIALAGALTLTNPVAGAREFGVLVAALTLFDLLLARGAGLSAALGLLAPRRR